MTFDEYYGISLFASKLGPVVTVPRRIIFQFIRPYFFSILLRDIELRAEITALKKDLLATNNRIDWIESQLREAQAAANPVT